MKKLDEYDIAQSYVGKKVNEAHLQNTFRENGGGGEYIAYCNNCDEEECDLFGITDILLDKWDYDGIDFRVYVLVKDGRIADNDSFYQRRNKILKYKETYGGHGRPSGYELTPTQQEIRIFRRIMDYVTAERVEDQE